MFVFPCYGHETGGCILYALQYVQPTLINTAVSMVYLVPIIGSRNICLPKAICFARMFSLGSN